MRWAAAFCKARTLTDFAARIFEGETPNIIKIAVIIGSTRPGRVGEAVARWVYDIADFNLPLLDEPIPPSQGQYSQPHTIAWAGRRHLPGRPDFII